MEDSDAQDKEAQSLRIWKRTIRNLRQISALTDETQVLILDRLVATELRRLERKQARGESLK